MIYLPLLSATPTHHPEGYTETLSFLRRHQEDEHVFTYTFRPLHPITFEAGQYAHLRLLSLPEGTRRVREFSFASAPHELELSFGIDTRSGSPYQQALMALRPRDTVELFKIRGHMTWPPPTAEVVMIAGGVGITPFRSMLRDSAYRGLPVTSTLVQVASGTFLYAEELFHLADKQVLIRRPEFLTALSAIADAHPSARYLVAGSRGFVTTVAGTLAEKNIPTVESDEFKGLVDE